MENKQRAFAINQKISAGFKKINFLNTNKAASSPVVAFAREIIRSPRQAGAICPSGVSLSEAMARDAVAEGGLVVELGAGTGAVTSSLLKKGITPEHIVAVEQSAHLAAFLKARFPRINVLEANACRLAELFSDLSIDTIVSSLPLVSLPKAARESIIKQMRQVAKGKRLIQFTYFWGDSYLRDSGLKLVRTQTVFKNFPPARVMTFEI